MASLLNTPSSAQGKSRLSKSPREAALDVLEQYWAEENGAVNFPVDPVAIAQKLKADVLSAELESDVSGLLVKKPGEARAKIYLNSADSEKRQRFTCAHEIGHLAHRAPGADERIGYVDSRDSLSSTGKNPDEVWANQFAAELLMPAAAVRTLWAQGKSSSRAARVFGVSQEAMQVRLVALGLS